MKEKLLNFMIQKGVIFSSLLLHRQALCRFQVVPSYLKKVNVPVSFYGSILDLRCLGNSQVHRETRGCDKVEIIKQCLVWPTREDHMTS